MIKHDYYNYCREQKRGAVMKEKDKIRPVSYQDQQRSMKLDRFFLKEDKEEEIEK